MIGKTVLLVGGYDKGLDYRKMFKELPTNIEVVICYGENRDKLILDSKGLPAVVIKSDNIEDAIAIASKVQCENVLFSPATSSFDRFANYVERGNFFRDYVLRLQN